MGKNLEIENLTKKEIVNKSKNKSSSLGVIDKFKNFCFSNKTNSKLDCEVSNNSEENNGKTKSNSGWFSFTKFFKIKHVKSAVIVLIFSIVALFILNSSFGTSVLNNSKTKTDNLSYVTSLEYCEKLENKLVEVLKQISGAGDVSVMITVESGPEIKIATSNDERTNTTTNGSNTTTNSTIVTDPIIVTSQGSSSPLVVGEIVPKITGVVVVAKGAKDAKVKLNLLEAVQALLDVSNENIQIYY